MDASLYPRMAEVEDQHWWFAGRRTICDKLLTNCGLPRDAAIFEPGCGTGGNFPWLAGHGQLFAMDSDPTAVEFATARRIGEVARGVLPDAIPFAQRFDLVVMTDVIEHLDEPVAAMRAVHARLKPSGVLLLTAPALPRLWSEHDVTHHHRRRYRLGELRESICAAGFTMAYLSYYNFILLPAIALARALSRVTRRPMRGEHDLVMPPAIVNQILFRIFASERRLIGKRCIPLGVSLIALARA